MNMRHFSRLLLAIPAVICVAVSAPRGAETFQQRASLIIDSAARMELYDGDCNYKVKPGLYFTTAKFAKGDIVGARAMWNQLYNMGFCGDMFTVSNSMSCFLRYQNHYTADMVSKQKTYMQKYSYFGAKKELKNIEGITGSTENHYLMSATGGYLAAETWADFKDRAGIASPELLERTRNHIYHSIEQICKYGLKEYDSPTYHVFYVNCYTILAEHAKDPEMRSRAKIGIDMSLATLAAQWQKGVLCATSLRASNLNLDHSSLLGQTGWLFWGGHKMPKIEYGAAVVSAIASYRIPDVIYLAGTDRSSSYIHRESDDQNPDSFGTRVCWPAGFRQTTYMGKNYGLFTQYDGNGTIGWNEQMMRAGLAWYGGRVIWKPKNSPRIQYLQNGPSVAGATAFTVADSLRDTISGIVQTEAIDGWTFMKGGDAVYIAYTKSGNGFALQTADVDEYASLGSFKTAVLAKTSFSTSGQSVTFTDLAGDVLQITYDGRGTTAFGGKDTDRQTINNRRVVYGDWPRIDNPWMHAEVGGNRIVMQGGSKRRTYDLINWTVSDETNATSALPGVPIAIGRRSSLAAGAKLYTVNGRLVQRNTPIGEKRRVTRVYIAEPLSGAKTVVLVKP